MDAVRNIVFDLGKVLLEYDWQSYLASFGYDNRTYKVIADAVFLSPAWIAGDQGIVTPEEWLDSFLKNAPGYEKEIREVYANLGRTIYPMPYTDAWIQYFKERGYRLFFLSNYSEGLFHMTRHHMGFMKDFDGGIFSYQVRCIKPEEKIYRILIDTYQLKAEETMFFDDRDENVKTAQMLGMKGVVFHPDVAYQMLGMNQI